MSFSVSPLPFSFNSLNGVSCWGQKADSSPSGIQPLINAISLPGTLGVRLRTDHKAAPCLKTNVFLGFLYLFCEPVTDCPMKLAVMVCIAVSCRRRYRSAPASINTHAASLFPPEKVSRRSPEILVPPPGLRLPPSHPSHTDSSPSLKQDSPVSAPLSDESIPSCSVPVFTELVNQSFRSYHSLEPSLPVTVFRLLFTHHCFFSAFPSWNWFLSGWVS